MVLIHFRDKAPRAIPEEDEMKLGSLIERLNIKSFHGNNEDEITAVVYDTRKVVEGCLFVCIKGENFDSHNMVDEVIKSGARAIVSEREMDVPEGTSVTVVDDTRYALAVVAAAWFGYPADTLKVIGITGTKGKTTTTYMVKSILESVGMKVGLIGTIETVIGDEHTPAKNTTPESYIIQESFRRMLDAGCTVCVMEASSQGFLMHRTAGFTFEIGVFTNIEPDHIGPNEHKDFDDYLRCKSMLFSQCRLGIVNGDDKHSKDVIKNAKCDIITYGLEGERDLLASDISLEKKPGYLGVKYKTHGIEKLDVHIDLPGRFSVYNSLAAICICSYFKVPTENMLTALKDAKVKGRIEMIRISDEFALMIDYAHNAMSLESLLSTLKEYAPERIVCVFGCGGNRSKLRRYDMGEVSGRLADLTIITSDNPRFEKPEDIIDDIETGIKKTDGEYIRITDRKEAIRYAILNGRRGDVIVLAGKGHEDYQEIEGVKYPMDERDLIRDILREEGL